MAANNYTNVVAFLKKESVHKDFHPLMGFLKNSPISYALAANPTIYAEIIQQMSSTADCRTKGEIKFTIKGKSYTITPSVINEALHLPNSNFESLPTDEELISMLNFIGYASDTSHLGQILYRKYLRKEWAYFFYTLTRVFTATYGGRDAIPMFVQKIAYSLMYGRTIDIGSLLFDEFFIKLFYIRRGNDIYYARFFMIIANYLCKDFSIDDRNDTLQVRMQSKLSFSSLGKNKLHTKVKLVLPKHIRAQISTLSPSPSTKVTLPSQSLYGKRKKTTLPSGSDENEKATGVNPSKKKMDVSVVKPERLVFDVDPEMPPGFSRDGVLEVNLPSSPEKEKPKCNLHFVLEPTLEPNSIEKFLPEDRQHLVNAASVLKSMLVARLTSCYADKLRTEDMSILANKCYNTLEGLGDNYTSFRSKVDELIAQHEELESIAKKKNNWNDTAIRAHYNWQMMSLSDVSKKLSTAEDKLSGAKSSVDSLKFKREELIGALLKLTKDLYGEEERVKNLTTERDRCKEAHSDVEAELEKLGVEKEKAREAFEAISDQYYAAKRGIHRINSQLLQLVRK